MRRRGTILSVALTVAVLVAAAPVAPARAGDHDEKRVGPADTDRHSPSVAVDPSDPSKVVIATFDASRIGPRIFVSRDGGRSFAEVPPPKAYGWQRWEPAVALSRGRLWLAYTGVGGGENVIGVLRSDDLGTTWTRPRYPVRVVEETKDRCDYVSGPSLALDPSRPSVVFVAWESWEYVNGCNEGAGRTWVTRSDDGGTRFSPKVEVPLPERKVDDEMFSPRLVLRPDGSIASVAEVWRASSQRSCPGASAKDVAVALSDVAVRSFTTRLLGEACGPKRVSTGFTPAGFATMSSTGATYFPGRSVALAGDARTGALTAVWVGGDAAGVSRLFAAHSPDGRSWRPTAVPAEPPVNQQHFPAVATGPDGRLVATYIAQLPGGVIEPRVAIGAPGATSWSAPISLAARPSVAHTPRPQSYVWLATSLGHATAVAVGADGIAHPAWVDLRDRTSGPTMQVWARRVRVAP